MKQSLYPFVILLAQAAACGAATISVNLTDDGSADSTMGAADIAGAPQVSGSRVANWNNYDIAAAPGGAASGAATALSQDSNGGAIATTVAYTGAIGAFRLEDTQAVPNGDDRLWKGFLDIGTGATVTVANIPYATYNVIVYFDGANGGDFRVGSYDINGGTALIGEDSEDTDWKKAGGQNPTGIYQQPLAGGGGNEPFTGDGSPNNSEGNYVLFTGITGSSFDLNANGTASDGVLRAPINGFQIVQVPEPSSALLAAIGSLALLRRRRA